MMLDDFPPDPRPAFRLGDRVQIAGSEISSWNGREGSVVNNPNYPGVPDKDGDYWVDLSSGNQICCSSSWLTLVSPNADTAPMSTNGDTAPEASPALDREDAGAQDEADRPSADEEAELASYRAEAEAYRANGAHRPRRRPVREGELDDPEERRRAYLELALAVDAAEARTTEPSRSQRLRTAAGRGWARVTGAARSEEGQAVLKFVATMLALALFLIVIAVPVPALAGLALGISVGYFQALAAVFLLCIGVQVVYVTKELLYS